MPIYHNCEQYSEEYEKLRRGIPTASCFSKILTPEGKPSKQWEAYAHHLIAERCLGRKVDSYTSPAMEYGLEMEPDAVAWYEAFNDVDTKRIGFVTNDAATIGCSPDRLVGDDGLLQIKIPAPQTQIGHLLTGKLAKEYKPQLQGELYVTGRKWVDIASWNPELPRVTIRVERDETYIGCLDSQLFDFNTYLHECWYKIQQITQARKETYVEPEIQY